MNNKPNTKVKVLGAQSPKEKLNSFDDLHRDLKKSSFIAENIKKLGYKFPTEIQSHSIPILLKKRDLLGIAPTGSGKTIAFLVRALAICHLRLLSGKTSSYPVCVIVSPTRELSLQIKKEALKLSVGSGIVVKNALELENSPKNPCDILISTPYSLYKLAKNSAKIFKKVKYLVLDEGDRLLSSDFARKIDLPLKKTKSVLNKSENIDEKVCKKVGKKVGKNTAENRAKVLEQVDAILSACCHKKIQRVLFSATLPGHIETLAKTVLRDPVKITVGHSESSASSVKQTLKFVGSDHSKFFCLTQLFEKSFIPPVLIFVQSKKRAADLFGQLSKVRPRVGIITSHLSLEDREKCLESFNLCKTQVLICTDLMARGIDFKSIETVINFDFPPSVTEYIQRVGRAGRAGQMGNSVTFFTEDDKLLLRNIAVVIRRSGGCVPSWILELDKIGFLTQIHALICCLLFKKDGPEGNT